MKANEVLELSRITLKRLREKSIIKAIRKPNGYYEYAEKSVYEHLLKSTEILGNKTNQHFVSIPFRKIIDML